MYLCFSTEPVREEITSIKLYSPPLYSFRTLVQTSRRWIWNRIFTLMNFMLLNLTDSWIMNLDLLRFMDWILRCWTLKLETDYEFWYTNWYGRLNRIFADFFRTFWHTRIWNFVKMFNCCWNCWLEIAWFNLENLELCQNIQQCWNCWLEISWLLLENLNFCRLEIIWLFWKNWTFVD